MKASINGHTATVQALLGAGADHCATDEVRPPRRRPPPVRPCPLLLLLLLLLPAHTPCARRCRRTSQDGNTALHFARLNGRYEVEALLEAAEQVTIAVPAAEAPVGGEAATSAAETATGAASVACAAPPSPPAAAAAAGSGSADSSSSDEEAGGAGTCVASAAAEEEEKEEEEEEEEEEADPAAARANCPGMHGLARFVIPGAGYSCDACGGCVAQGAGMYGCRLCNHDVCGSCWREGREGGEEEEEEKQGEQEQSIGGGGGGAHSATEQAALDKQLFHAAFAYNAPEVTRLRAAGADPDGYCYSFVRDCVFTNSLPPAAARCRPPPPAAARCRAPLAPLRGPLITCCTPPPHLAGCPNRPHLGQRQRANCGRAGATGRRGRPPRH